MSKFGWNTWNHTWMAQKKVESWVKSKRDKSSTSSGNSTSSSTDQTFHNSLSSETPPSPAYKSNLSSIEKEIAALTVKSETTSIPTSPSKTLSKKTSDESSGDASSASGNSATSKISISTSPSGKNGQSSSSAIWNIPGTSSGNSSGGPQEWLKNKAARLIRTPSISSQSSVESGNSKNGYKLLSPQVRTFGPDGRNIIDGSSSSEKWSPMLGRSPSPHRALSLGNPSCSSPSKGVPALEIPALGSPKVNRCPSPLLLPSRLDRGHSMVENGPQLPLPPPSPLGAIQRELYLKNDEPIHIPAPEKQLPGFPLGTLRLKLKYDFDKSDLNVHLIEAENLPGTEKEGFSEPFVKVTLLPEVDNRDRKTGHRKSVTHTIFDEKFKFPISYNEIGEKTLMFQINENDRYIRNEIVGEVKIPLANLNIYTGIEVFAEIARQPRAKEELQEIFISLNYLPSAERLTVIIVKARNLSLPFSDGKITTIDPAAKVYLLVDGKRLKKKKTQVCKNTPDPTWNEYITFNINDESLKSAAIEICVSSNGQEIGWCFIDGTKKNIENHWTQMVQQPRKSVVMWHPIR